MHLTKLSHHLVTKKAKLLFSFGLLAVAALVISACMPVQPAAEEPAVTAEAPAAAEAPAMTGDAANGEYIATLTGGCGCHFNQDLGGLAGGNKFEGPFGVSYASNITSDAETGIGNWTPDMIVSVLHTGSYTAGGETTQLVAAMPYGRFSSMSVQEAYDVAAWLMSLDPIANDVPERELTGEVAAFTLANPPADTAPTEPVARGQQLETLAACGGCHSPRNEDGSPKPDMMLAGAPLRDAFAANITPDEETGIGSWTEEQIAAYMKTGARPDGTQAEGAMAQQIERRFSKLNDADAAAIAAFLKSIPAVKNDPAAQ